MSNILTKKMVGKILLFSYLLLDTSKFNFEGSKITGTLKVNEYKADFVVTVAKDTDPKIAKVKTCEEEESYSEDFQSLNVNSKEGLLCSYKDFY